MPSFVAQKKTSLTIAFCVCLILIITFIAFFPSLKCGFVNWDDENYVVNNTAISSVSAEHLKSIFTSVFVGHYQPLTILSYLLDHHIYNLNPFGYHLTNLILHLFNCLFVFWLIYLLSGNNIGVSFLTAALFAIHPLRVESVTWISERKDVLYSFFYLSAAITYLYYLKKDNTKYYLLSLFLFLSSLLSKSMAVTLPLLLLLLDYYLKRKPDKWLILDKIPYFCLSAISSFIVALGLIFNHGVRSETNHGFLSTISIASYSIVFYLFKLISPIKLSSLYPYYSFQFDSTYLYSILIVITLILTVIISFRYTRKLLFGSAFFLIVLLPVLQFIPSSSIIVADRYTYISSIGIFFIFSSFIYWLYKNKLKYPLIKSLLIIILSFILLTLAFLTYNRCKVWKDGITLWDDVSVSYPDEAIIYNNLGTIYGKRGELDKAVSYYKKALNLDPNYAEPHNNLGVSLLIRKEYDKALFEFINAIKAKPGYAEAYSNIGALYGAVGDFNKAKQACAKAIDLDPSFADAYYNLSVVYYSNKQYNLAYFYLQRAIKLGKNPDLGFLKEVEQHQSKNRIPIALSSNW